MLRLTVSHLALTRTVSVSECVRLYSSPAANVKLLWLKSRKVKSGHFYSPFIQLILNGSSARR